MNCIKMSAIVPRQGRVIKEAPDVYKRQEYGRSQEKDYLYHMHTALQIARTSYDRESLLLDEDSWDRIAAGADAFFPYFYELLEEGRSIDAIPMIEIYTPKKRDVQRRKTFYIHEELLLQQYVLNELLSSGVHLSLIHIL